ncbi:MAG: hypothetical protein ABIA04_06835 [Pseudomonadota bacterium]
MKKQIIVRSRNFLIVVLFQFILFMVGCTSSNNKDTVDSSNQEILEKEDMVSIGINAKFSMDAGQDPSSLASSVSVSITDSNSTSTYDLSYAEGLFSASEIAVTKGTVTATLTIDANGEFGGPYISSQEVEVTENATISFEMYIGTDGAACEDLVVAEVLKNYAETAANERTLSIAIQDVQTIEIIDPSEYTVTMSYAVGSSAAASVTPTIEGNYIKHTFEITENEATDYTHTVVLENECSSVSFTLSENLAKQATVTVDGELTVFSIDMNITSSYDDDSVTIDVDIVATDSEGNEITDTSLFDYDFTFDENASKVYYENGVVEFGYAVQAGVFSQPSIGQYEDDNEYRITFNYQSIDSLALVFSASATPKTGSDNMAATVNKSHSIAITSSDLISLSLSFVDSAGDAIEEEESISFKRSDNGDVFGSCEISSSTCTIEANLDDIVSCLDSSGCSAKFYYSFESVEYEVSLTDIMRAEDNASITGLSSTSTKSEIIDFLENDSDGEISGIKGEFSSLLLTPSISLGFVFFRENTTTVVNEDTIKVYAYKSATDYIELNDFEISTSTEGYGRMDVDINLLEEYTEQGYSIYFRDTYTTGAEKPLAGSSAVSHRAYSNFIYALYEGGLSEYTEACVDDYSGAIEKMKEYSNGSYHYLANVVFIENTYELGI